MLKSKTLSLALATAAGASAGAQVASAELPTYAGFELVASDRSGAKKDLPSNGEITVGSVPVLGNNGAVAFRYTITTGGGYYPTIEDNIWHRQSATATPTQSIAKSTGFLAISADGLSDAGALAFSTDNSFTSGGNRTKGLYVFSGGTLDPVATTNGSWGLPALSDDGVYAGSNVRTTPTSGTNALRRYTVADDSFIDFAATTTASPPGTESALFGGVMSSDGDQFLALPTSGAAAPLTRYNADGSKQVVSTGYTNIGNSGYDINDDGMVAFFGRNASGQTQLVTTTNGTDFTTIATAGGGIFSGLQSNFAPMINDEGIVAFEGTPVGGTKGLYVSDGASLLRVVGVGDAVPLATGGTATISGLSDHFDINDAGQLSFIVTYAGGGEGVYVTAVPEPGTVALLSLPALVGLLARRRRGAASA